VIMHVPTVSVMAAAARGSDDGHVLQLGGEVVRPALGIVVLAALTLLNVHKPRGLTPYGERKQAEPRAEPVGR